MFFTPDRIGFLDFETRSPVDIKAAGAYRYMLEADATLLPYALADSPVQLISVQDFSRPLAWGDMPDDFRQFHSLVLLGQAIWCAWNSPFDRAAWNYATLNFPWLEPWHIIDAMVQGTASGLPPALDMAGVKCGLGGKQKDGKALINLFSVIGGKHPDGEPQSHPEEWTRFQSYAIKDVEQLRGVYLQTRPLPIREWQEFWASEAINERGVGIDVPLAEAAARMALADKERSAKQLTALTRGAVGSVTAVPSMKAWLTAPGRLDETARQFIIKREAEFEEDENDPTIKVEVRKVKLSLSRKRAGLAILYLRNKKDLTIEEREALELLELREFGGSATPAKFTRMLAQHIDGVIMGQYQFSGAPQTGRFSGRGVQVQNLLRDALPYEIDAIDALLQGKSIDYFATLCDDTAVSRKLSMLIRPTITARPGKAFVWSDWSQIEARVLPWLAASEGGDRRLDIFRAVDADPTVPDLYTRTASDLSHLPIADIDKALRQRGKVAELALGFAGGVGALLAMGAGYGLYLPPKEAKEIVDRWRLANPWAVTFWDDLWEAIVRAMKAPGLITRAGRVLYLYDRTYMNGTLFCELPSGRILTYAKLRHEEVDILDDDDQVIGREVQLRFSRGFGRAKLWKGLAVENIVQATAADVLRGTLLRLEADRALDWMPVRLHTHDEILVECEEKRVHGAALVLRREMQRGFDWSDGLPINSEETIARFYSKAPGSIGL